MGFIGSHTAVSLIENGYDVVIVDNLVNSEEDVCTSIRKIQKCHYSFYNGDCRDENLLDKIFNE